MIKRLYIDNYKSLVNFELPLRELTLLLGPNGVGKTSVLDVVFAMRLLLSGQPIRFRRRCCAPITPS
jgi:predicted ATPase